MKASALVAVFLCLYNISFAQDLELSLVADGFSSPLEIQHAGDERLFIVEQGGTIKIIEDGIVLGTPFLDISADVQTGGERGLLGLAFHPDYSTNGHFFVYYTDTNGDSQVSRFTVSNDPNIADGSSEVPILDFEQPFTNHNGGHIAFGPDGKLYIASGDGGGSGDPDNRAQNLNTVLGKILRLDVDIAAPYIPADNPFVGVTDAREEIFAYGLRNPWKFSFDSATGAVWIADVGQGAVEEINKETDIEGLNFGWRCYEGSQEYDTSGDCPQESELTFPFAEYDRVGSKCSITGGYVYRGEEFPAIEGLYFFADFCSDEIGTVDSSGNLTFHGTFDASGIVSFGTDVEDNLYLAAFTGGSIYKIEDNTPLGTSDLENKEAFLFYPNPATDAVTFDFPYRNIVSLTILDFKGSSLNTYQTKGKTTLQYNVSDLAKGVYWVVVTQENGNKAYKELIVH